MANVNITIDGKALSIPAGTSLLAAARANGIHIPTLCFMEKLESRASCRMCVVEVEGARTFQHACATKVRDGMVVHTDTEAVRASRKMTLELLLSNHPVDCHHCLRLGNSKCDDLDPRFCEMCFFCDCVKDGFCDLQALAREYKVDLLPFTQKHNTYPVDATTAIVRNPNKCVKCKRCVDVCGKVQTVHNLAASGRGCEVTVGPAFGKSMAESGCVGCGRCVEVCPTGAIFALEHKDELVYFAHKEGVKTVAQVSSELIPELERVLKLQPGTVTMEQLAGSLKKIGIDHVVDAADANEAANEIAEKLLAEKAAVSPMIITNSYAAQQFLKAEFPGLADAFCFYDSALSLFGKLAKEQFAQGDTPIKTFAFGPVGGDAAEAEKTGCVDIAVNARELARIMIRTGSEPNPKRTAEPETLLHEKADNSFAPLLKDAAWNMDSEAETFELNGLKCAVCHNLGQARALLSQPEVYDIVRVIA